MSAFLRFLRAGWLLGLMLAGCSSCRTLPPYRVSLRELAKRHSLELKRTDPNKVLLTGHGLSLSFHDGSSRFTFNNVLVYMNGPVDFLPRPNVSDQDALTVLTPLLNPVPDGQAHPCHRIALDAGHGGTDSGALSPSTGAREKDIVRDIAARVRKHLTASGAEVRLIREGDETLSLAERATRANAWPADIFVSIHANSAGNGNASGVETYVIPAAGFASTSGTFSSQVQPGNAYDRASILLAFQVHRKLLAGTRTADRGIRRARFSVIRNVHCPGILVETGFLSNAEEAGRLNSPDYREKMACSIAEGILAYGALGNVE